MWHRLALIITAVMALCGQAHATGDDAPWLLVDTSRQALSVMVGDEVREVFGNISVGRGGSAELRFRGDGRTPKGNFHVAWVNPQSRFHLFFGLDYPNLDHAERALQADRIDSETYSRIGRAVQRGQTPPQDTPLGGYIGIHGLGRQDPRLHEILNWTQGCVALTDRQIDQLARWVEVGMRVVII
jgi:murein L,D-transpeptidase YafK